MEKVGKMHCHLHTKLLYGSLFASAKPYLPTYLPTYLHTYLGESRGRGAFILAPIDTIVVKDQHYDAQAIAHHGLDLYVGR